MESAVDLAAAETLELNMTSSVPGDAFPFRVCVNTFGSSSDPGRCRTQNRYTTPNDARVFQVR